MVAALRVSALRNGLLPVTMEASLESLTPLRVPVPASAVVVAVPRIPRTDTCAALAFPTTVGVVLVVGTGNSPPSCAKPAAGHVSRIVARATAMEQRPRELVRCMQSSLNWHLTHTSSNERKEAGNIKSLARFRTIPVHR